MRLADLAQQAALATFGEPVTLVIDGNPLPVVGIFVAAHEAVEFAGDAAVSTVRPLLTVQAEALPTLPVEGDEAEIRGNRYVVADVRPDGFGMVKLFLQEAG